jgi:hypothetical protein
MTSLVLLLALATARPVNTVQKAAHNACATAEFHQFDFWIGDWDVFRVNGGAKSAHVVVDRILDGCAIREQYEGLDGEHGQSLSSYYAPEERWQQTWVTNQGALLVIHGRWDGTQMAFEGSDAVQEVRATWKPVKEGVRETAEVSADHGKTWKPWFDLIFRRRPAVVNPSK